MILHIEAYLTSNIPEDGVDPVPGEKVGEHRCSCVKEASFWAADLMIRIKKEQPAMTGGLLIKTGSEMNTLPFPIPLVEQVIRSGVESSLVIRNEEMRVEALADEVLKNIGHNPHPLTQGMKVQIFRSTYSHDATTCDVCSPPGNQEELLQAALDAAEEINNNNDGIERNRLNGNSND